jgi:hypothetical protein
MTKDMEDAMDLTLVFLAKMGGQRRKLIHFLAGQIKLAHWCWGTKDSEKMVVVARRGQRQRNQRKEANDDADDAIPVDVEGLRVR